MGRRVASSVVRVIFSRQFPPETKNKNGMNEQGVSERSAHRSAERPAERQNENNSPARGACASIRFSFRRCALRALLLLLLLLFRRAVVKQVWSQAHRLASERARDSRAMAVAVADIDERMQENKQWFLDFIDENEKYQTEIANLIARAGEDNQFRTCRLIVNLDDLRNQDPTKERQLRKFPLEFAAAFQQVCM